MAGKDSAATLYVRAQAAPSPDFALDIEFEAPPGVTVLFGPSGSGKSTTLAAIAGLVKLKGGKIALGNEVWFDSVSRVGIAVHQRRIAYVFQSLALFPHMTAAQNVAYGMTRESPRAARRERAVALLTRFRVEHLADRRPPTFSGGEAQRVALARALATSPRVVLLDEPFSALDRDLRRELVTDLGEFVRELGVPVLFVTHHRQEARALGERVVLFDRGRVKKVAAIDPLILGTADSTFDETPLHPDRMLDP